MNNPQNSWLLSHTPGSVLLFAAFCINSREIPDDQQFLKKLKQAHLTTTNHRQEVDFSWQLFYCCPFSD